MLCHWTDAEYLLRMGLSVPEVVSGLITALSYAQEQLESLINHTGKIFSKNNQILDKCHNYDKQGSTDRRVPPGPYGPEST